MIKSWEDFEERRAESLKYTKLTSETNYLNALSYFEYVRKYFQKNSFPDEPRTAPSKNFPNGKPRKFTDKETKQQKEEIRAFIHEEKIKKFRAVRGSNKKYKR